MKALFNNNLIDTPLPIMPDNRAFQFGDGIFETIWYKDGRIPLLSQHINRLTDSAKLLRMNINTVDLKFLEENIETLRQLNFPDHSSVVAKLMCWRHASERPGYWADQRTTDTLLTVRPYSPPPETLNIGISESLHICTYPWSSTKSMNSLPYIMASMECRDRGLDELVLCNQDGKVAECISSNIFILNEDKEWLTPPVSAGGVAGTMRAFILEAMKVNMATVREEELSVSDLIRCTGMVLTRTTGLAAVHRYEDTVIPTKDSDIFISAVMKSLK